MSDPQLPPVPPPAPNGNPTHPPQQQFPSAPPAASALPADPQYPAAPPYGTPQPPYGQQAPQQQAPQQQAPQQQAPQYPGTSTSQSAYPHPGAAAYGSAQQPAYGAGPAPTRPAGSSNTLARVAFIIALAVAAIGALQVLIQPFLLSSIGYYSGYGDGGYGIFTLLFGVVTFLASAAALVLGLIAVRRPGSQVFAGVAIGVGGVQLLGIVLAWISSLFYAFL